MRLVGQHLCRECIQVPGRSSDRASCGSTIDQSLDFAVAAALRDPKTRNAVRIIDRSVVNTADRSLRGRLEGYLPMLQTQASRQLELLYKLQRHWPI